MITNVQERFKGFKAIKQWFTMDNSLSTLKHAGNAVKMDFMGTVARYLEGISRIIDSIGVAKGVSRVTAIITKVGVSSIKTLFCVANQGILLLNG